ncbi:MAG: HEAT repeat domain-containing protein [Gammaproteobacteria bacterium]|nr:HEAT repeat domain-containing protein [Gammaproteobacteria bacterium]
MSKITDMNTIKTTALTFITIVACVMLLLTPDSYRDEALGSMLPTTQEMAPINHPQTAFRYEHKQPVAADLKESLPVVQKKPESSVTSTIETKPVDWALIMYPELARIEALENQSVYTALGELSLMLTSDDPVIRLAAIESLGDMTNQATLPALTAALNDPNPQLRIAALEALAAQEDESAVSSIEPYLYDEDSKVKLAAIDALTYLESETAVPALAGLLSDQDVRIRHHAVNALGDIGGEYAISYLLQARYDPDERIRANAESILGELES